MKQKFHVAASNSEGGLRINPYTQEVETNVNIGTVRVTWDEDGNLIVSKEGTLTNYGEINTYRDRYDCAILVYDGKIFKFQYSDSSSRAIVFTNDYVKLKDGKSYLVTEQYNVDTKGKINYFSANYELTVNF